MTRMIERWFPCQEVSENSAAGWGSGNAERNLFTWFAARPTAQAKAAVICSLLPWPDDEGEQKRLQALVREAMTGRYAAREEVRAEILNANPDGASLLDPFSGRGMIPLEAARLGIEAHAIEYSPVALLASKLLTDYPFRDWRNEPELPYAAKWRAEGMLTNPRDTETAAARYYRDVEATLREVGARHAAAMAEFYPQVDDKQPWGYLWAVTLPCQECGHRFPLVGSYNLRMASVKKATKRRAEVDDPGQSYYIDADPETGTFTAVVHEGPPRKTPTLANRVLNGKKVPGKSATCPFCAHVHPKDLHQRLMAECLGRDALLVVADHDPVVGKTFRPPTAGEVESVGRAGLAVLREPSFTPLLPAVPHETIAIGNSDTIRPSVYGAKSFGDLMVERQTLSFIRLCRVLNTVGAELSAAGISSDYGEALSANVAAQMVRQVKRATRGTNLDVSRQGTNHIFVNESTIAFSYDNFEAGIGTGPATWNSMITGGLSTLRNVLSNIEGRPVNVVRGTATAVPIPASSVAAVVTDPPYDEMIAYADASDLFYVWLKRALITTWPAMAVTADEHGAQDKSDEVIVKRFRAKTTTDFRDHRTREHYDTLIGMAFSEMRRVVRDDGIVTIVFGHGDPEVWRRLLTAISSASLVMTGSWPANTESGGQQGAANITTTLTMACRPAAADRPQGRKAQVEAEVRAEVKARVGMWETSGLAPTDMLMASAGPAMEVVGRYEAVTDIKGDLVDPADFLVIARRAVQQASRIEIDHHPLDTFDARTRFALWWLQLFAKNETAKSELRWQTLAADLELDMVRDLLIEGKGVRFTDAAKHRKLKAVKPITGDSAVIDVALAMAAAWPDGLGAVGEVLAASGREDDPFLWAVLSFLTDRLPDADPDATAATTVLRTRHGVEGAARGVVAQEEADAEAAKQGTLDFGWQ